ncbi:MAG: anti-sigma F factor [Oscillospiraceae bacterium]|nr:anti-sigma F factor [Oscillospiraceae bacterium]
MNENKIRIEFPSKPENERFARTVAAAFIVGLDPTIDQLTEVKTAISEAVTNAIVHGYEERDGIITIEGKIDDRTVELSVKDNGVGIPDIRRAREPLFTGKPEKERSGMGFTIMETFMDALEIESEVGKGTRVIMRKNLE